MRIGRTQIRTLPARQMMDRAATQAVVWEYTWDFDEWLDSPRVTRNIPRVFWGSLGLVVGLLLGWRLL